MLLSKGTTKAVAACPVFASDRGAHPRLHHGRVGDKRGLDLDGGKPVPGNVDHVVGAPEDPDVPVVVEACAVPGQEPALLGVLFPVGGVVALRVAPHGAGHRRAGLGQHDEALHVLLHAPRLVVDDVDRNPGQRAGAATGLERGVVLPRGKDRRAGFRLPPGVDHRDAGGGVAADLAAQPAPGLRVHGLADGSGQRMEERS